MTDYVVHEPEYTDTTDADWDDPQLNDFALVKYIVGESKNCLNDFFECFSTRFAEDLLSEL
ncbi:MAG: hypothetical protein QXG03_13485, partial [Halalkalicoccus sp.]